MTKESPSALIVSVENIGTFTFAQRNLRLDMAARVEFARLTEGAGDLLHPQEREFFTAVADLKIMCTDGPKGWSSAEIDALDPFDTDVLQKVLDVWYAFRQKEQSFRSGNKGMEAQRQGDVAIDGVPVSPPVQSGTD